MQLLAAKTFYPRMNDALRGVQNVDATFVQYGTSKLEHSRGPRDAPLAIATNYLSAKSNTSKTNAPRGSKYDFSHLHGSSTKAVSHMLGGLARDISSQGQGKYRLPKGPVPVAVNSRMNSTFKVGLFGWGDIARYRKEEGRVTVNARCCHHAFVE